MADTNKINSFKEISVVAIALQRNSDKRYLLARRGPGHSGAGQWEFPGGKVEENESQEEALVREIDEELGLVIKQNKLRYLTENLHVYPDKTIRLYLWGYQIEHDVDFKLVDHDQVRWLHPKEMHTVTVSAGDIPFVDFLAYSV